MTSPTICLCMVVRNEEKCIDRCLRSVNPFITEMVIVDTGSTDQTVEICREYGASIINSKWEDDFSKARNAGIDQAKADWILWLDADEEWKGGTEELLNVLNQTTATVLSMPVRNFHGEGEPVHYQDAFLLYQYRLFRRDSGIRFINRIHERLLLRGEDSVEVIRYQGMEVHHYGYLKEYVNRKRKTDRNITLLQKEAEQNPNNPWLHYHLAGEYAALGQFTKAYFSVNNALLLSIRMQRKPPSIFYRQKYGILMETGNWKDAWPAIEKAIILYPDYVDLYFYKGCILYFQKEYEASIKAFKHCLELGEDHVDYLILTGTGSFRAWEYIGLCLEETGRKEEAEEAFRKMAELKNRHEL